MKYHVRDADTWVTEAGDPWSTRGDRVYLAGPMTGLPDFNYPAFHEAAAMLRHRGIPVHNPAEQHGGSQTLPRATYLRHALAAVVTCEALVVLPGWQRSKGAQAEMSAAKACEIPIYRFEDLIAYLNDGRDEPEELAILAVMACGFMPEFDDDEDDEDDEDEPDDEPDTDVPPRASILNEARDLITGDRNNTYGPPTQDFARTAAMARAMGFKGADGREFAPHHVAMFIALVKLSRLTWSPGKRDNWTDLAGYAGCGYECVVEEECP